MKDKDIRIKPTDVSIVFGIIALCMIPFGGIVYAETVGDGAKLIGSDVMNQDGFTGDGVKVAIFAEGFDNTNVMIIDNISKYVQLENSDTDDTIGTAAAEVIIDIAPDVELYLYETISNDDFTRAINDVKQNGIKIILIATVKFNEGEPPNTSFLSEQANIARENGILWISPAGDVAKRHWNGTFTPDERANEYGGFHKFICPDFTVFPECYEKQLLIDVKAGETLKFILNWDAWNVPENEQWKNNYDLVLFDGLDQLTIDDITPDLQFTGIPFKTMTYEVENDTVLGVTLHTQWSSQDANMHLFSVTHDIKESYRVPQSSILIPGDSPGALTVGATSLDDELESFSSQGPTDDGRIKPDVVAPNGVSTTSIESFTGTISSASHVAGMTALIQEKFPNATPDQIQTMIEYTTANYHEKTNTDGTGRVSLTMFSADILALDVNNDCDVCFYPRNTTISVGDMISLANAGVSPITLSIVDDMGNQIFDDIVQPGESSPHTFNDAGVFEFSDSAYPNITGTITVLAESVSPGNISGVIFSDINKNNTQDAGEMGIPNVVISINSLTDTTDNMGAYSIDMIPPGTYTISFDMPDGYSGESSKDITISSGNNELNFPLSPDPIATGGIAGNIFSDDDSNDIRGPFEVGISTDISLVGTNYSTTSKPNGNYSFLNIPVGEYQVRVTPPSGYSIDTDTKSVTISEDYTSMVNFAMTPDPILPDSTTIYGVVFSDTNWNGIQDEGEPGIADYTMIAIYGQELLHDITDNDGRYSIDVSPGVSYQVQTQFFPQGHVVHDEKSSWFEHITVPSGESKSFDVGFHPVTPDEMVQLELNFYLDENFNRQYDSGEDTISVRDDSLILFYTYTYTIGPVSNIIPDNMGRATTNLVPADFAVLVDVDNLASLGYSWAATEYERSDDMVYDGTIPVGNDPAPGSRHVMYVGLWEN